MLLPAVTPTMAIAAGSYHLPSRSLAVTAMAASNSKTDRPEGSLDRRAASGIAALTLLNIASLSLRSEPLPVNLVATWDPAAAAAASRAGAACPTVSCANARFAEINSFLDLSKYNGPKNTKGTPAERMPIVYLDKQFGMRGDEGLAAFHVVVVSPARDDNVQLIWLRDASTGRVVASRSFDVSGGGDPGALRTTEDEVAAEGPPTLVGTIKEGYQGVYKGQKLVPAILYESSGLWEGKPFTLCSAGGGTAWCEGEGLLAPPRAINTGNKRGAAGIGAAVLEAVAGR